MRRLNNNYFGGPSRKCKTASARRKSVRLSLEVLETRDVPTVLLNYNPTFGADQVAMTYDHGQVLNDPYVYVTFMGRYWGDLSNPQGIVDRNTLASAVQSILQGPYLSGLQQYEAPGATAGAQFQYSWTDINTTWTSNPATANPLRDYLQSAIDDPSTPLLSPDAVGHPAVYVVVTSPNASNYPGGFNYQLSYVDPTTKKAQAMNAIWIGTQLVSDGGGGQKVSLDRFTRTFSHELVEAISGPVNLQTPTMQRLGVVAQPGANYFALVNDANSASDGGRQIADFEPDHGYTYRLSGYAVSAYWSQLDQGFIVPDGNSRAATLTPLWVQDPTTGLYNFTDGYNLSVTGQNVTVDSASDGLSVTVDGSPFAFDAGLIHSLTVHIASGVNTVNVEGLPADVALGVYLGGAGTANTVNFSPTAGQLDNLLGSVAIYGGAGTNTVTVNDRGTADQYFLNSTRHTVTYVVRGGELTRHDSVVRHGVWGDTFSNFDNDITFSGVNHLTVYGGPCANTYDVQTDALLTPLSVYGGSANDMLGFDDSANTATSGTTYTLTAGRITRVSVDAGLTRTATVDYHEIPTAFVDGGKTDSDFYIFGTQDGTDTGIIPGPGRNTFSVGDDTDPLDGIAGGLHIYGQGTNTLVVNDRALNQHDSYFTDVAAGFTLTAGSVVRSHTQSFTDPFGTLTFTSTATITYTGVQSLVVEGGSFGTTFNVQGTAAGTSTRISGGAGDDTFIVGSAANTLDTLLSPVTLDGGGGNNTLTVNDQGNPAITTWARSAGRIVQQRLDGPAAGRAEIDYANTLDPVINAGPGLNTLTGTGPQLRTFLLPSAGDDEGINITTDAQGNFYVTGWFAGTVDFDPSAAVYNLTAAGSYDGYVAKYSPAGRLLWARDLAGSGQNYFYGWGVAADATGNVYVNGWFTGTASIGNTTLTSAGGEDVAVAKLDVSGTVLWARSFGGSGNEEPGGIAVDSAGNVYLAGFFEGTAAFGGTTLTSAGGDDVFVAKLTSAGTVSWAKRLGGSGRDWDYDLAVDRSGNVYLAGNFQGPAAFGGTTLTGAGSDDVFVAKLTSAGTVAWARQLGGSGSDWAARLALDGAGSVYVTGAFQGTAAFGGMTLTSAGGQDGYVAKLSSAGVVQWARDFGGSGGDGGDGLAVDAAGTVYVAGYFQGTAAFGSAPLTTAGTGYGGCLLALDGSGTVQWAKPAGTGGEAWLNAVAVDGAGTLDVLGALQGLTNVQPGAGTFNLSGVPPVGSNSADAFVVQLTQAGPLSFTGLGGVGSAAYRLRLSGADLQIVDDATGQVLLSKTLADTTAVAIQAADGVNTTLTVDFSGGAFSVPVSFVGGTGTNTLVGPDVASAWSVTGANAGKVGTVSFSKVANLVGGSGVDVFKFTAAGSLSGRLDGGAAPVHQGNWLDYSGLASAVAVNLQTGSASKVAGGAAGQVAHIQNVHGGDGGSTLTGNSQGNILIGGLGADTIQGGSGRSLLIGGKGADHVTGGSGGDILIGDYTTYDAMTTANQTALMGILAEWQSAHSYATRFHDINTGTGGGLNGAKKLNWGTTVKDDVAADAVTAAASAQALDWFFQGLGDQLFNLQPGEHVNNT
jgi:hypothetical protein